MPQRPKPRLEKPQVLQFVHPFQPLDPASLIEAFEGGSGYQVHLILRIHPAGGARNFHLIRSLSAFELDAVRKGICLVKFTAGEGSSTRKLVKN